VEGLWHIIYFFLYEKEDSDVALFEGFFLQNRKSYLFLDALLGFQKSSFGNVSNFSPDNNTKLHHSFPSFSKWLYHRLYRLGQKG